MANSEKRGLCFETCFVLLIIETSSGKESLCTNRRTTTKAYSYSEGGMWLTPGRLHFLNLKQYAITLINLGNVENLPSLLNFMIFEDTSINDTFLSVKNV